MYQFTMDELQEAIRGSETLNRCQRDIRQVTAIVTRAYLDGLHQHRLNFYLGKESRPRLAFWNVEVTLDIARPGEWKLVWIDTHGALVLHITVDGRPEYVLYNDDQIRDLPLWLIQPVWRAMPELVSKVAVSCTDIMVAIAFFQAAAPRVTA